MEVILLEKIENLGNLGVRVNVKPGFGRNFLLPQGKALRTVPVTDRCCFHLGILLAVLNSFRITMPFIGGFNIGRLP